MFKDYELILKVTKVFCFLFYFIFHNSIIKFNISYDCYLRLLPDVWALTLLNSDIFRVVFYTILLLIYFLKKPSIKCYVLGLSHPSKPKGFQWDLYLDIGVVLVNAWCCMKSTILGPAPYVLGHYLVGNNTHY